MRIYNRLFMLLMLIGCLTIFSFGQNQNGCINGQRHGITYTDCWADNGINGIDTQRLQAALSLHVGKVVFNESNYTIDAPLTVFSYRIIEGTTRNPFSVYGASNIVQTASSQAIFEIGEGVYDVSIRDIALVGGSETTGTIGIKASGQNGASTGFQFSNLKFHSLYKGIYVEANGG